MIFQDSVIHFVCKFMGRGVSQNPRIFYRVIALLIILIPFLIPLGCYTVENPYQWESQSNQNSYLPDAYEPDSLESPYLWDDELNNYANLALNRTIHIPDDRDYLALNIPDSLASIETAITFIVEPIPIKMTMYIYYHGIEQEIIQGTAGTPQNKTIPFSFSMPSEQVDFVVFEIALAEPTDQEIKTGSYIWTLRSFEWLLESDAYENDSESNPVIISIGTLYERTIHRVSDIDYFQLNVTDPTQGYSLIRNWEDMTGNNLIPSDFIEIFNPATKGWESIHGRTMVFFEHSGIYLMKVSSNQAVYSLQWDLVTINYPADEYEPNNTNPTAVFMEEETFIQATLHCYDDLDRFYLTITTAPILLDVELVAVYYAQPVDSYTTTQIILKNTFGSEITSSNAIGRVRYHIQSNGTYYIDVKQSCVRDDDPWYCAGGSWFGNQIRYEIVYLVTPSE